ncbi:Hypothetical protein, putative [Bodo saltans]|uniref:Uncharacterized protein n=1 Tax=Bodo saltans TaxID=75058 RepID=A0A0S4JBP0_BODSA|nr:Hypothetical protein, putative [Bodo saltans]|eukprot:CUG88813.1 Hypothetical protein, putative [Bodo saltans]
MRGVDPFQYDQDNSLDDYVGHFRAAQPALTQSATHYVPQQKPTIPLLIFDDLRECGCEYAAPVHGSDPENKGMSNGDLERRKLFLKVFHQCILGICTSDTKRETWFQCTLRRMSRFRLERVAAAIKRDKKFSVQESDAQDVSFLAFCGGAFQKSHAGDLKELFYGKGGHPLKPPDTLVDIFKDDFDLFQTHLNTQQSACMESVVAYAKSLVEFMIPSYVYILGAIPDPTLWSFDFSAADIEDLYHGNCNQSSVARVIESLKDKSCLGPVAVCPDDTSAVLRHQRNLAYHTHVMLLGLQHNERRLLSLLYQHKELLAKLDEFYVSTLNSKFGSIHYVLKVRRRAQEARQCQCAKRLVWHPRSGGKCINAFIHHFLDESGWNLKYFSEFSLDQTNSKLLEEKILKEVGSWPVPFLVSVVRTLRGVAVTANNMTLFLGCGSPTDDPHRGEGYDRMVHIVTSTIRKLVLGVRLCHENARALSTKYWHFSGADLHVINIPYDLNTIVVSHSQSETFQIIDVGLDLHGWYGTSDEWCSSDSAVTLTKLSDTSTATSSGNTQQYALLKPFLVAMAKRNGAFVLHGFCDGVGGLVHEVRISVSSKKTGTTVNELEDLEFVVRLDSENIHKSTVTTLNANQRSPPNAFLRLGILLHDTALSIGPDDVVAESGDCLSAALEGERRLASGEELLSEHRSRALQLSPSMLALLPRTHAELKIFLEDSFERLPVIEKLFFVTEGSEGVGVLGLSRHDMATALAVLRDTHFGDTETAIDEASFPTKYGFLQELSSTSGISVVQLTVAASLSEGNIEKLVNLTRGTSLRLILEVSKLTFPFFNDKKATFTTVQLEERRIVDVVATSQMGKLSSIASRKILDFSDKDIKLLSEEAQEICAWAEGQYASITADAPTLFQDRTSTTDHTKLVIIVNDGMKVSSGSGDETNTDVVFIDLKRTVHQHDQVQDIVWRHSRKLIIVVVHQLDLSSTVFFSSQEKDTVIEPISVLRPDLTIPLQAGEARVAKILGCSADMLNAKPRAMTLIDVIRKHRRSTTIPSFQAYIMQSSLCELLPHYLRVALYLKLVLEVDLSWVDTVECIGNCCHNISSSTIWDSIATTGEEPIHHLPAYELVLPPGSVTTAINHAIESAMREGTPISEQLIEEWLEHRPSPASIRRFILSSLNPLSLFVLNPGVTVSLLLSTDCKDVVEQLPLWVARLQTRARSAVCQQVLPSILSIVRWVVLFAGGDVIVTRDDLENIFIAVEGITLPVHKINHSVLQMVFGLDIEGSLAAQHKFKTSLQASPDNGGIPISAVDDFFRSDSCSPLGTLFVCAFLDADKRSALLRRNDYELHQIKKWAHGVSDNDTMPPDFANNIVLKRFTASAWAELMLRVTSGTSGDIREKVMTLIDAWSKKDQRNDIKLVEWCCKHRGAFARADHVISLIQAKLRINVADCPSYATGFMWPLDPLDGSKASQTDSVTTVWNLCNEVHKRLHEPTEGATTDVTAERGATEETDNMAANFNRIADYIEFTTAKQHRVRLVSVLIQSMKGGFTCDYCDVDNGDCTIWVFAALWILAPMVSCMSLLEDEEDYSLVQCLSAHISIPGAVQTAFADAVKKYRHIAPPLALALIGWVEYVPLAMMLKLSKIPRMWNGRIKGPSMENFILVTSSVNSSDDSKKMFSFVVACKRPLPRELIAALHDIIARDAMQPEVVVCRVSEGFSERIFVENMQYLRRYISSNDTQELHNAELVFLWFWCLGFYAFPPDVELSFQALRARLIDCRNIDISHAVISPVVLDVHVLRPLVSELLSVKHFDYLCEGLTPVFPECQGLEDWTFSVECPSLEAAVEGFANVSALRYLKMCTSYKQQQLEQSDDAAWELILAHEVMRPARALKLWCPEFAAKYLDTIKNHLEEAPSCLDYGGLMKVNNDVLNLTKVLTLRDVQCVPVKPKWRAEFPEKRGASNSSRAALAPSSLIKSKSSLVRNDRGKDDSTGESVRALLKSQYAGRSIDVSLILMLHVAHKDPFCLTLKVTPGSVCHFVEHEGTLEMTNSLVNKREIANFKSHGHAWNFCKSFRGPMTLVGKGFFLYRSKNNSNDWRCFIGRGQPQQQDSSDFYFWHISAFHTALSLSLPLPLEKLLLTLCNEVYDHVSTDLPTNNHHEKIEALIVSDNSTKFREYRAHSEPLLAFCRLLIRAAISMRSSEEPRVFPDSDGRGQTAPARVGTVFDAMNDVLHQMLSPEPEPGTEPLPNADAAKKCSVAWIDHKATHEYCAADVEKVRDANAQERIQQALRKPDFKSSVEDCVRCLSSIEDCKFALFVLSEQCYAKNAVSSKCHKLLHVKLAFEPLVAYDAWTMLAKWSNNSISVEARLRARNNRTEEEFERKELKSALVKKRLKLKHAFRSVRTTVKSTCLGEGLVDRLETEVDHCWMHVDVEESERYDDDLRPQPHIIWKYYDPDAYSINDGETIAHVLDASLCCYSDEPPRESKLRLVNCDEGRTLTATRIGADFVDIDDIAPDAFDLPRDEQPSNRFQMIPHDTKFVRLKHVKTQTSECMLVPTPAQGWKLEELNYVEDNQVYELLSADELVTVDHQLVNTDPWPFMFRWSAMMIESPLPSEAKSFFLHHMHVPSLVKPPTSDMFLIMMYCIAQLCPAPPLRDRLLGALVFTPNDLCLRRDRMFGVIMTRSPGLPIGWENIPNRVEPITLDPSTSQSEQYRTIVKKFTLVTTHVAVTGMKTVPDRLLKWCCEHTKKYPWRFILFLGASANKNAPENRDRVVTLKETFPSRTVYQKREFDDKDNQLFLSAHGTPSAPETPLIESSSVAPKISSVKSTRRVDWVSEVEVFVNDQKTGGGVILLVGPPGTGKTTELTNIQNTRRNATRERKDVKFVTFDCSDSAIVTEPLVTLLDNASLGIELGAATVIFVADEYHFLANDKKDEFQRWVASKIHSMGFVLISNRKDSNDEAFNKRFNESTSHGSTSSSIIWYCRVSAAKMREALQNVRMDPPATMEKGVAFLCTIRTLFSDDVVSLRMAADMCVSSYGQTFTGNDMKKPSTPLEFSLWSKLQRENDTFAVAVVRSFEAYYDRLGNQTKEDIIAAYTNVQDPIDLLVFTAMLPVMLTEEAVYDEVPSYVELMEAFEAYHVHPAIRLAVWVRHMVDLVAETVPDINEAPNRKNMKDIIALTSKLEIADDPTFFPLIYGVNGMSDLTKCDLYAFSDALEPRDMLEAVARHEALHWKKIADHWLHHPVYDLENLMKLTECVPPKVLLGCLTSENAFHLVQQGLHEPSSRYSFLEVILRHYPKQAIELEGGVTSPYFFCVWHQASSQPMDNHGELWVSEVEQYLPPTLMPRFLQWVVVHGALSAGDRDELDCSTTAAHVVGTLANGVCNDEQHAQLWRSDRIASFATISAMSLERAQQITRVNQPPHPMWPAELKALCGLSVFSTELAHVPPFIPLLSVSEQSPHSANHST